MTETQLGGWAFSAAVGDFANYAYLWVFVAVGGVMNIFRVNSMYVGTVNIKLALYTNTGTGNTRMAATRLTTVTSTLANGNNDIKLPVSVPLTNGTTYWIAYATDQAAVSSHADGTVALFRYAAKTYSTWEWPDSFASEGDFANEYSAWADAISVWSISGVCLVGEGLVGSKLISARVVQ